MALVYVHRRLGRVQDRFGLIAVTSGRTTAANPATTEATKSPSPSAIAAPAATNNSKASRHGSLWLFMAASLPVAPLYTQ